MSGSRNVAPLPFCLDGIERELARTIVATQEKLVSRRGYRPQQTIEEKEEITERVISAVSSSFSAFFGSTPRDRYVDIFDQVASFAEKLSKDHIFPDANKRTTVVVSLAFIVVSGVHLDIPDEDDPEDNEVYLWIQDVVIGDRSVEELAQFLREKARW